LNCTIHNFSSRNVFVDSVKFDPIEPEFSFQIPELTKGFIIEPGKTTGIPVIFKPISYIKKKINVVYYIAGKKVSEIFSELFGETSLISRQVVISPAHQIVDISKKADCRIMLESGEDISDAGIMQFDIEITYNPDFLKFYSHTVGNLIDGKFILNSSQIDLEKGKVFLSLNSSAGAKLNGKGELLRFGFDTYLPKQNSDISEINVKITPSSTSCVEFQSTTSKIEINPTCLYDMRKVIFSPVNYSLSEVRPNPASQDNIEINFSVGLKGYTEIIIYNSTGATISKLLTETLSAGTYTARLQASELPAGIYWYRMTSGPFTETKTLVITR
jgi:hypothetical protein